MEASGFDPVSSLVPLFENAVVGIARVPDARGVGHELAKGDGTFGIGGERWQKLSDGQVDIGPFAFGKKAADGDTHHRFGDRVDGVGLLFVESRDEFTVFEDGETAGAGGLSGLDERGDGSGFEADGFGLGDGGGKDGAGARGRGCVCDGN